MKTTRLCSALALIYAAGFSPLLQAQESLERVTVTGSSIKRLESETALPVTVITRAQIEQTGATSVEELLKRVSANTGAFSDSTQGAGYATSNANLRGLGANSTLVLLNGRRLANHPFGNIGGAVSVDLNSIPFAALERVEVLRDGASAVYGSDAVGGVINFITRRDYRNGEVSLRYGNTQKNLGGAEKGASLALGFGDLGNDGFNVLLTGSVQTNTRLRAVDQELYMRNVSQIPGSDPPTSGRAYPGRLVDYGLTPGAYQELNPGADFIPCDPVNTVLQVRSNTTPSGAAVKRCRFIYAATLDNLPDQDKADIYGRATFALSKDHTLFAEASAARNHSIGRIAPVPIDSGAGHVNPATGEYPSFAFPVSSKYFPAALLTKLGYDPSKFATLPNGMTEIAMRAVPVGNRINDNTNEQMRVVLGANGVLGGWDYDTGLTLSRAKGSLAYRGYINEGRFLTALATGKINPFGPSDAEGQALLQSTLMEGPMRQSTSNTTEFDLKISRELMAMAGGNMALAMGVDLRQEKADDQPINADYAQGLHIGGEGSVPPTSASRNVYAAFGELSLPFAKGWEGSLAARYDKYSDFGSTFNPRASLRFQATKELLLRAAVGTGFRAPTLWDVNSPPSFTNTANSLVDPDCPAGFAGDPRCETQFNVRNSASPGLKPETSKQFTLGLVLEPSKYVSATLDYWRIEKSDLIGQVGGDAIFSDSALYSQYKSRIRRTAAGFVSYVETPVENLGGLKVSGVDIDIRSSINVPDLGRVRAGIVGTYVAAWDQQSGKNTPYTSYAGTAGDGAGIQPSPRWQHTASLEVQNGDWTVALENVFVRGWTEPAGLVEANVGVAKPHRVSDSSRWNLSTAYKGFKNLTLRLGARNILNEDAPYTAVSSYGSHAAGYAASFTDPRGRFFYGNVTYQFK